MAASPNLGRALVIIPTYNEADCLAPLIEQILALRAPLDVLVVDDNSPDGTGALVDGISSREPRLTAIHRAAKMGLGTAYLAGFRHALASGYGFVCTMDADFSHNPRYLPDLLALMDRWDVSIGSRYVTGGGATGCSWGRVVISRGANVLARTVLGLKAHDCTAGFRCYRASALRSIDLASVFSSGYSFMVEMITLCQRQGLRIAELPIVFENRRLGASKISRAEILRSFATIARLYFRRTTPRPPGV